MLVNSSFSARDFMYNCMNSTAGNFNFITLTVTSYLIILPLCIHVIYLGLQRWRQQRSGMTMSHSDHFTYHMAVIELMNILGFTVCCCGILADFPEMIILGLYLSCINLNTQQSFHILTCVERYVAVVHPVTYLGLRKAKGIRIRNISIVCVWLQCFISISFISVEDDSITILSYFTITLILIIICFCSLSVLHILIRPGPGEGGGGRQRIDQSKLRAIYTIVAILGVLLLRFGGTVVGITLYASKQLGNSEKCIAWFFLMWSNLPSSLVLPLLFLHRAGKLPC